MDDDLAIAFESRRATHDLDARLDEPLLELRGQRLGDLLRPLVKLREVETPLREDETVPGGVLRGADQPCGVRHRP